MKERARGAQVARPGGRQPHDKGNSATAKALGTSRDDVRRAKEIANILPKAKAAAKAAGFDHNKSALLKIAREVGTTAQIKKVRELAKQKKKPRRRLSRTDKRHLSRLTQLFYAAIELKRAWAHSSREVRKKFILSVLKPTQ